MNLEDAVEEVLRDFARTSCVHPNDAKYHRRAARAVLAALQLTEEQQWVVITRDGERCIARSKESAEDAVRSPHPDDIGERWQPDRVEQLSRMVTPWATVED